MLWKSNAGCSVCLFLSSVVLRIRMIAVVDCAMRDRVHSPKPKHSSMNGTISIRRIFESVFCCWPNCFHLEFVGRLSHSVFEY